MALQPGQDSRRFAVVGIGQAGVVALCAAGLFDDRITSAAAVGSPVTYITEEAYATGTHMGLLAPGILRVGDIPHLAALCAPRRLVVAEGATPQGKRLGSKQMQEAFAFTKAVYKVHRAESKLQISAAARSEEVAKAL
jgi:hypothetical protein